MRILSPAETRAAPPWDKLIDALDAGIRAEVTSPLRRRHHMAKEGRPDDVILLPGQHVDLIGSFTPDMREAADVAVRRSRAFIDTGHAKVESGDIKIPLETSVISENDILGTLTDLCRGTVGVRASGDEITFFKSVGMAAEDLSVAIPVPEIIGGN